MVNSIDDLEAMTQPHIAARSGVQLGVRAKRYNGSRVSETHFPAGGP